MDFSNRYEDARKNAEGYIDHLLTLLGDRDPWGVQGELLDHLEQSTRGMDDAALGTPEKPGKWSVLQVIQHLADTELIQGYRMRSILAQPGCKILGIDQDAWASECLYDRVELPVALEQLRAMRAANLGLLRRLDDEQWERSGVHAERGGESVRRIFLLVAAHDILHRNQIERIKRALAASR
jgi:hypothetical protein